MNNQINIDQARKRTLAAAYKAVRDQGNEAICQAIRDELAKLESEIKAKGAGYARVLRLYEIAVSNCNQYIDLSEPHDYRDEAGLMEAMKENGIEAFTISSSWSGMVESAWIFNQNGYTVSGMVEVNTPYSDAETGECEKKPAFLFRRK